MMIREELQFSSQHVKCCAYRSASYEKLSFSQFFCPETLSFLDQIFDWRLPLKGLSHNTEQKEHVIVTLCHLVTKENIDLVFLFNLF